MLKNKDIISVTCIITLFVLVFGLKDINMFPFNNHLWAQSDWFSITIGYLNNGFDFFHPETLISNKQFPSNWNADDGSFITSTNFPIINFFISVLMHFSGIRDPWIYRTITLLISIIGIVFLYLTSKTITQDSHKSLIVICFALSSPVYLYYFNGFLPSIHSLTMVIIGLWAYFEYYYNKKIKYWIISIVFLTIATLIRTSEAVPLVAVLCFELFRILVNSYNYKSFFRSFFLRIPIVIFSLFTIVLCLFWNSHLRNANGSLFLNNLMPPRNWGDVYNVFYSILHSYIFTYFTLFHYIILIILLSLFIIDKYHLKKIIIKPDSIGVFLSIYVLGSIAFFVAMMKQFNAHDYYFLDTFYLPVLLCLIILIRHLPYFNNGIKSFLATLFITILLFAFSIPAFFVKNAGSSYSKTSYNHFEYSDIFLDSVGISKEDKILSLFSFPQNMPFIQMNRTGYSVMFYDSTLVENALLFDYKYIVIEDSIIRTHYDDWKYVFGRMERLYGNNSISICRMKDSTINNSIETFFAIKSDENTTYKH